MLLNLLLFDMDLQEAIDAARFRHFSGRRVAIEPAVSDDVLRMLESMGHELADPTNVAFGGAQAVMRLPRGWAPPRRNPRKRRDGGRALIRRQVCRYGSESKAWRRNPGG